MKPRDSQNLRRKRQTFVGQLLVTFIATPQLHYTYILLLRDISQKAAAFILRIYFLCSSGLLKLNFLFWN